MDPKVFEIKLSEIGRWQRVDEDRIYRNPELVDPAHRNPQIEVVEFFKKSYLCDWCERRQCTGRRSMTRAQDKKTGKPVWRLYCYTCKCYFDPRTQKLIMNTQDPDTEFQAKRPVGRPRKNP